MQRARRAATAVLALAVLCLSSGPATVLPVMVAEAAPVAWPTSTLVVSEVQTGGASASDEFVEIANQGVGPVDLIGLEVVYATSSGSTVTRKAMWPDSTIIGPGQRLLIANGVGSYVGFADATYSGGFAATGGALALRIVGGSVIDAIGWGDATNAFVEGVAAPAPPAGTSLERRPGGVLGNGTDTNDNSADWFVSSVPSPQNLASPAVPDPGATPGPIASPTPSPTTSPMPTPTPTTGPTPPEPTSTPTVGPTPEPTPTVEPTPTPTPVPTPSPSPTPSPTPAPISIAAARALPNAASATVTGVLTTDLGALESGRTAFIQDDTAGIALYLDAPVVSLLPAGTSVVARGVVDERYAQRTLRIVESELVVASVAELPAALEVATGAAVETYEGTRIRVSGMVVGSPDSLADGTAVSVDDGSGPVRIVVTPSALAGRQLRAGSVVTAAGPLGQRDSTGSGTTGYRIYVVLPEDITIEPPASPTPVPTPTSSPDPTLSPTPDPDPSMSPTPSASPSASVTPGATPSSPTIAAVRELPVGSMVSVRGVVTAEPGRLGIPALFAIGDATGGIVVRLPDGVAPPGRGRLVDVKGPLADPYGQLEIRPATGGLIPGGTGNLPAPVMLPPDGPDETSEGRLVRIDGLVVDRPTKATSGAIGLTIETSNGTRVKVMADASSGVTTSALELHARYRITGISGQRATKKGALDGYRIWVRDRDDIDLLASAPSGSSPSAGTSSKPRSGPSTVSIGAALKVTDRDVAVEAVVTAPAKLLDATGRRIVVQDASAAVEVLLPKDVAAPPVGARVRVIGRVGSAYGAPRLRADSLERRGSATVPAPLRVTGPLTAAHTWRLVSIGGRVDDVRKLGDRWRAEVVVGAHRLVVVGQPGSRTPSTALVEGRVAEVVGIARAAYPSATDRRPAVLPRSAADIHLGAAPSGPSTSPAARLEGSATGASLISTLTAAPDVDLADLGSHVGELVRVGGLVVELRPTGFTLDDATATGQVELIGPAAEMRDLIEPDDVVNVAGRVRRDDGGNLDIVVDDPAAISLASALHGLTAAGEPDPTAAATIGESGVAMAGVAGDRGWLPGAGVGLAGLLGICVASIAVTVVRRRHGRRLLTARVADRLAAIGARPTTTRGPITS